MIVVDTNVIAYLFLPGVHSGKARAAFLKDAEWCAPLLWRSEFRNVLALYLCKGQLSADAAIRLLREAEALMEGRECQVSSDRILSLAGHSNCSAYDCEFVALAEELVVPLVTSDAKMVKAFPRSTISLPEYVR
jgi:predicted nucleic acid-binding protein